MNYKCPNADCESGHVADRRSINGLLYCPVCHGKGYLEESLPIPNEQKIFSSDLDFTKPKNWRPFTKSGSIHGIPSFNGKAIATDGVLVVIERPQGDRVIAHLDSFIPVKQAKRNGSAKEKKPDVNADLFE